MENVLPGLDLRFDDRLGSHSLLEHKLTEAERLLKVRSWKAQAGRSLPLIACLTGGTGTGKSTLFNSLVGAPLSRVESRRPTTLKPLIFMHEDSVTAFAECPIMDKTGRMDVSAAEGDSGLLVHRLPELAKLILVDAPDFDSVELENRRIADDFLVIGDIIIFVTSQEKYADLAGQRVRMKALEWGKKCIFVMNKVVSDAAFLDFRGALEEDGVNGDRVIRIERFKSPPECIPGLRDRPEFSELFAIGSGDTEGEDIRAYEIGKLRQGAAVYLNDLNRIVDSELDRITSANHEIRRILHEMSEEMGSRLDAVLPSDIEGRVQDRLKNLLRKYDIFFTPRLVVRNVVKKAFGAVSELFWSSTSGSRSGESEGEIRSEDLQDTRAAVNLAPLESAVARFNLEVARFLSSDKALEDLRKVAREDVCRWNAAQIRSMFDEEFPGVEGLLEAEFTKFREGLSRGDEFALDGSYTVSALMIVTAEIVMGGGFSLLDALLGGVIVPFIPKWLLNLKILDLLREIGERVDHEYRRILGSILEKQADLYTREFRNLLPEDEALNNLSALLRDLRV